MIQWCHSISLNSTLSGLRLQAFFVRLRLAFRPSFFPRKIWGGRLSYTSAGVSSELRLTRWSTGSSCQINKQHMIMLLNICSSNQPTLLCCDFLFLE